MMRQRSAARLRRALRRVRRPSYWRREARTARLLKPAYVSLLLRWFTWLLALVLSTTGVALPYNVARAPLMLSITGLWLLVQTAYLPVLRTSLSFLLRRTMVRAIDQGTAVCAVDMVLAGLAIVATGGWGSPFYVYGLASVIMPALLFGYRAALLAGVAFSALFLGSVLLVPESRPRALSPGGIDGLIGFVLVPAPLALFAAYLGQLTRQLEAERDRTRLALVEAETLRAVTTSGLRHVAAPERFVAETVARLRQLTRLRGAALIYHVPAPPDETGDGTPARRSARAAGFGPVQALIDRCQRGEPLPDDPQCLTLPLAQADRPLGLLLALTPDVEARRPFLTALAGQVSAALANAHLYAEAEALAAQAERARLAREIHDGIAQSLFMLTLNLEACAELIDRDPEQLRARLQTLIELARQTLWQTRHYIHDLKPLLGDARGLRLAIENQIKEFGAISGLPVELRVSGAEAELPPAVRQALYRIIQEGLANVFKHAGASRVTVALAYDSEGTRLTIEDDGRGFVPAAESEPGRRGFGLSGMRERAEELGGRFELASEPGQGTRLSVWVPHRQPARVS